MGSVRQAYDYLQKAHRELEGLTMAKDAQSKIKLISDELADWIW